MSFIRDALQEGMEVEIRDKEMHPSLREWQGILICRLDGGLWEAVTINSTREKIGFPVHFHWSCLKSKI